MCGLWRLREGNSLTLEVGGISLRYQTGESTTVLPRSYILQGQRTLKVVLRIGTNSVKGAWVQGTGETGGYMRGTRVCREECMWPLNGQ